MRWDVSRSSAAEIVIDSSGAPDTRKEELMGRSFRAKIVVAAVAGLLVTAFTGGAYAANQQGADQDDEQGTANNVDDGAQDAEGEN
jgi:hypothetical protein